MNPGQDSFLDELTENRQDSTVFLITGKRLMGTVVAHDKFTISLEDKSGAVQLVYKHAISTVVHSNQQPESSTSTKQEPILTKKSSKS